MRNLNDERPKPKWVVAWGCESDPFRRVGQPAKIGRLPCGVREELNRRLQQGEPAAQLAKWLNGLAETKSAAAGNRRSAKITVGDIAGWKKGGFRDWEATQERRMNMARHCLAWVRRPEMQDKLFGRRESWLEILNKMRSVFGREQLELEDMPADQPWDAIPTPKERRTAEWGMLGMTPEGDNLENAFDAMGYFGPPRNKPATKKTIKPQKL